MIFANYYFPCSFIQYLFSATNVSVTLLYNGDSWNSYIYWGAENLSNNEKNKFIIPEMSVIKESLVIL